MKYKGNLKAKNIDAARDMMSGFIPYEDDESYMSIQYKGSNLCSDFHCKCGKDIHFCGEYFHHVKCGHCKSVYYLCPTIMVIELEEEPSFGTYMGYDCELGDPDWKDSVKVN